ncbi:MAG: bifunctional cytidylyltransferase/SDR family oxidoreductase [Simkaniaceae bacterium]|nr:bifunctional cytidylyltransferase/SDR family oxidoreductase [Simkaniaceae bacterium]
MKAVLLMGGEGKRFGDRIPKQFLSLAGRSVYLHTLATFIDSRLFEEIILVCSADHIDTVRRETTPFTPLVRTVVGGTTRQLSSYAGLVACGETTDFVMIHDAVRPLVSQEILRQHGKEVKKHGAVNTCIPSTDTLVYTESGKSVTSIPDRTRYFSGQTPQTFAYSLILQAHENTSLKGASDDCSLLQYSAGRPIRIVLGSPRNIKITSETDLFLAEQLLRLDAISVPRSLRSLEEKTYAITGGTGGIGKHLATLLSDLGARPLLLSRSSSDYPVDLTDFRATATTFRKIRTRHGPLDGLINCAGTIRIKPFRALSPDEIDSLVRANLHSLLYSCLYASVKKGGHIINLSSSSFSRGRKEYAVYSATKAAVVNFTQGFAEEHPDLHINVVVPQRTDTPMRRKHFPRENPKSLLSPLKVARNIVRVLQNDRITGTVLEVRVGGR